MWASIFHPAYMFMPPTLKKLRGQIAVFRHTILYLTYLWSSAYGMVKVVGIIPEFRI